MNSITKSYTHYAYKGIGGGRYKGRDDNELSFSQGGGDEEREKRRPKMFINYVCGRVDNATVIATLAHTHMCVLITLYCVLSM